MRHGSVTIDGLNTNESSKRHETVQLLCMGDSLSPNSSLGKRYF
jgi:hypothetical protein